MDAWETLVSEMQDEGEVTEVIRPAAVVPEEAARAILMQLSLRDLSLGGVWEAEPVQWRRYGAPSQDEAGDTPPELAGTIQIAYGVPTRYEITIYRATVTAAGHRLGWTVESLCDEALAHGDLSLANCPRADLGAPPPPMRA
ncbi:MAG: hypothetical protein QOC82_355 [Frankiaceae bacterium]|nr:hypothetical protein [Frankiaceae bacterium]